MKTPRIMEVKGRAEYRKIIIALYLSFEREAPYGRRLRWRRQSSGRRGQIWPGSCQKDRASGWEGCQRGGEARQRAHPGRPPQGKGCTQDEDGRWVRAGTGSAQVHWQGRGA